MASSPSGARLPSPLAEMDNDLARNVCELAAARSDAARALEATLAEYVAWPGAQPRPCLPDLSTLAKSLPPQAPATSATRTARMKTRAARAKNPAHARKTGDRARERRIRAAVTKALGQTSPRPGEALIWPDKENTCLTLMGNAPRSTVPEEQDADGVVGSPSDDGVSPQFTTAPSSPVSRAVARDAANEQERNANASHPVERAVAPRCEAEPPRASPTPDSATQADSDKDGNDRLRVQTEEGAVNVVRRDSGSDEMRETDLAGHGTPTVAKHVAASEEREAAHAVETREPTRDTSRDVPARMTRSRAVVKQEPQVKDLSAGVAVMDAGMSQPTSDASKPTTRSKCRGQSSKSARATLPTRSAAHMLPRRAKVEGSPRHDQDRVTSISCETAGEEKESRNEYFRDGDKNQLPSENVKHDRTCLDILAAPENKESDNNNGANESQDVSAPRSNRAKRKATDESVSAAAPASKTRSKKRKRDFKSQAGSKRVTRSRAAKGVDLPSADHAGMTASKGDDPVLGGREGDRKEHRVPAPADNGSELNERAKEVSLTVGLGTEPGDPASIPEAGKRATSTCDEKQAVPPTKTAQESCRAEESATVGICRVSNVASPGADDAATSDEKGAPLGSEAQNEPSESACGTRRRDDSRRCLKMPAETHAAPKVFAAKPAVQTNIERRSNVSSDNAVDCRGPPSSDSLGPKTSHDASENLTFEDAGGIILDAIPNVDKNSYPGSDTHASPAALLAAKDQPIGFNRRCQRKGVLEQVAEQKDKETVDVHVDVPKPTANVLAESQNLVKESGTAQGGRQIKSDSDGASNFGVGTGASSRTISSKGEADLQSTHRIVPPNLDPQGDSEGAVKRFASSLTDAPTQHKLAPPKAQLSAATASESALPPQTPVHGRSGVLIEKDVRMKSALPVKHFAVDGKGKVSTSSLAALREVLSTPRGLPQPSEHGSATQSRLPGAPGMRSGRLYGANGDIYSSTRKHSHARLLPVQSSALKSSSSSSIVAKTPGMRAPMETLMIRNREMGPRNLQADSTIIVPHAASKTTQGTPRGRSSEAIGKQPTAYDDNPSVVSGFAVPARNDRKQSASVPDRSSEPVSPTAAGPGPDPERSAAPDARQLSTGYSRGILGKRPQDGHKPEDGRKTEKRARIAFVEPQASCGPMKSEDMTCENPEVRKRTEPKTAPHRNVRRPRIVTTKSALRSRIEGRRTDSKTHDLVPTEQTDSSFCFETPAASNASGAKRITDTDSDVPQPPLSTFASGSGAGTEGLSTGSVLSVTRARVIQAPQSSAPRKSSARSSETLTKCDEGLSGGFPSTSCNNSSRPPDDLSGKTDAATSADGPPPLPVVSKDAASGTSQLGNLMTSISSFLPSFRSKKEDNLEESEQKAAAAQAVAAADAARRTADLQKRREEARIQKQRELEERQKKNEARRDLLAQAQRHREEERRRKEAERARKLEDAEAARRKQKEEEERKRQEKRRRVEEQQRRLAAQEEDRRKAFEEKERAHRERLRKARGVAPGVGPSSSAKPLSTPGRPSNKAKTGGPKRSPAPESYEMSAAKEGDGDSSDSETERARRRKRIPGWARSANLPQSLVRETRDPDSIFDKVNTINLEEVFKGHPSKRRYRARASSGMWVRDRLTAKEELEYKKRTMGFDSTPPPESEP